MSTKDSTLSLRIRPGLKRALEQAASRECRSVTGLVEWLVTQHCHKEGIPVGESPSVVPPEPKRNPAP